MSGGDRRQSRSTPKTPPGLGLAAEPTLPTLTREEGSEAFAAALSAVALLAVDPKGLGGLRLRAPADPARDRLLAIFAGLLPAGAPFRKLPAGVADARLVGGLELAATLASGRPVLQRGLLAECDGGALVIPGAERLGPHVAGLVAAALDRGEVAIERDGLATRLPARFAVIACDEARDDDDPPPSILTERLGLVVGLSGVTHADLAAQGPDPETIDEARRKLGAVVLPAAAIEALAEAAERLGVFGLRPLIFACAAARAAAALGGRDRVEDPDLALAARLVLGPRATQAPAAEESPAPDEAPEPPPQDEAGSGEPDEASDADLREMAERVLEAAAATIPAGLLSGAAQGAPRTPSRAAGRVGAAKTSKRRGRPIGARPGDPSSGARLDLLETLRAAAPWQRMRRASATGPIPSPQANSAVAELATPSAQVGNIRLAQGEGRVRGGGGAPSGQPAAATPHPAAAAATFSHKGRREEARILVRREDFRVQRLKERRRTLTIFAVDASGSAALHRLAEAKGAVELLLADAYVRRDEVALIAFRGSGAELLLPPTRSLARAKRSLGALPGGGGTPLASGLDAALALSEQAKRRGDAPTVVLLTDGAANVARDGSGGRARAQDEAFAAAKALKAAGVPSVLIDVSPRPQARAKELAAAMAARYVALPHADAGALARAAAPHAETARRRA